MQVFRLRQKYIYINGGGGGGYERGENSGVVVIVYREKMIWGSEEDEMLWVEEDGVVKASKIGCAGGSDVVLLSRYLHCMRWQRRLEVIGDDWWN